MDAEYDGDDEACGICDDDEEEEDDEDMSTRQRWVFDRFYFVCVMQQCFCSLDQSAA